MEEILRMIEQTRAETAEHFRCRRFIDAAAGAIRERALLDALAAIGQDGGSDKIKNGPAGSSGSFAAAAETPAAIKRRE